MKMSMLMRSWQRGQEEINDIDSSNDISGKMIVIEKRDYDDGLFVQNNFRQRSSSLPPGEAAAQIKRIEEENGTKKSKIAEEVNISL